MRDQSTKRDDLHTRLCLDYRVVDPPIPMALRGHRWDEVAIPAAKDAEVNLVIVLRSGCLRLHYYFWIAGWVAATTVGMRVSFVEQCCRCRQLQKSARIGEQMFWRVCECGRADVRVYCDRGKDQGLLLWRRPIGDVSA